ncbi:hypothetical protein LJY25_02690 [Hymenobacter sp. BT175]|uniref:hypothetical protein n=1 Tax=Hymenobacter translucens TaxID=2886507 RepID=UPI001D0E45CE|nr:hypothetical protein [Hymenobacter translucens]MCC2545338.1 hypothetical protein [Hymenobacter translucens]
MPFPSLFRPAPARLQSLNWPVLNRLSFWLAVLLRCADEFVMTVFTTDNMLQTASAVNLIRGHGVSIAVARMQDLGRLHYNPLAVWPPGYAWLMGLLLREPVSDHQILLALWLIHILGVLLLFGAWWFLLRRLRPTLQPWAPAVFFLFWGIANTPFNNLYNTDLWSFGLYCAGVTHLLFLLSEAPVAGSARQWTWVVAMSTLSFAACLMRFAYYPLAFLPPLVLLGAWWRLQPGRLMALTGLALSAGLVGALVGYQKFVAGNAYYLTEFYHQPGFHIYWDNLRLFDPFLLNGVLAGGVMQLVKGGTLPYYLVALTVSSLVAAALVIGARVEYQVARASGSMQLRHLLLGVWVASALVLLGLLVALSLRYPAALVDWWPGGRWTYVADTRYFAPIMLIVSALLLIFLLSTRSPLFLRLLCAVLLLLTTLNALALRAKHSVQYGLQPPAFFKDKFSGTTADTRRLEDLLSRAGQRGAVLLTTNTYARRLEEAVIVRGGATVSLDSLLARQPLRTTRPVTIFLALDPRDSSDVRLTSLLKRYQAPPAELLPALQVRLTTIFLTGQPSGPPARNQSEK